MTDAIRENLFKGSVFLGIAMLAGCTGGGNQMPEQTVRTTHDTAPADLQLACANDAAPMFGVEAQNILPIASQRTQTGNYNVTLDVGSGRRANCVVGPDGTVVSITEA